MISQLRKILKGTGFKVVLWVILISFGIVFLPSLFQKRFGNSGNALFSVNNYDIDAQQFQQRINREVERVALLRQQYGAEADTLDPQEMAYRSLVNEALMNQVADKLSININDEIITKKLQDPAFVVLQLSDVIPFALLDPQTGSINTSLLRQYLDHYNISFADFERSIERKLRQKIVLDLSGTTAYASRAEIERAYTQYFAPKRFSLLNFSFDAYIKKARETELKQDAIEKFFLLENKKSKKYWVPEKRSGVVWEFDVQTYQSNPPADKAIESYYEKNKQNYLVTPLQLQVRRILFKHDKNISDAEIRQKAQDIRLELAKSPDQFADFAKKYSQDTKTASQGGLLDYFKQGDKSAAFERAAFKLQKDGEISDVIATDDGFEIIQRVNKKVAEYKKLETIRQDIAKELREQRFPDRFSADMRNLTQQENAQAIEEFARKKNGRQTVLKDQTVASFSPVTEELFTIASPGAWGFFVEQGKGYLVGLNDIKKSYEPELSTAKSRVMEDMYAREAQTLLAKDLEKAYAQAQTGKDLRQIKTEFATAKYESVDWLTFDNESKVQELEKRGLPVQNMIVLAHAGNVEKAATPQASYIIKLDEIKPIDMDKNSQKLKDITLALYEEKRKLAQRGFIDSLLRSATIKQNNMPQQYQGELPL